MASHFFRRIGILVVVAFLWPGAAGAADAPRAFRAGAHAVDVTPETFPVIVNGGFTAVMADTAHDRLFARWLVMEDAGGTRVGLCVVDSCMMPRELLDRAKAEVEKATGLTPGRVMISATHTHSAPAAMGCLGTDVDPHYPAFLVKRLVEGAERAVKNLAPARVGHASLQLPQYTHTRQWVYRPERMLRDPFGGLTVRANMHPGYQNAAVVGPTGPSDPELSLLAVQGTDGNPVALLANYSMHYFGAPAVSSDYFGAFCAKLEQKVSSAKGKRRPEAGGASDGASPSAEGTAAPPFVAIMSQGTSGDQHWMDYGAPEKKLSMDAYAAALADAAHGAWQAAHYRDDVTLAAAETDLRIRVRTPDEKRLAWAREVVAGLGGRAPSTQPQIYAREAVYLHEKPVRDVKLQALRVGDVGIAAIPCEVFALTGLKIKAQSPLPKTFNVELANGAEGYIPPPELHALGGYTTWPARTACLEAGAEGRIVEAVLRLLETVAGKKRRDLPADAAAPYAKAVLDTKPLAYFRLGEMAGPAPRDAAGRGARAAYEPGVLQALDGPQSPALAGDAGMNRCAHLAGGRVRAEAPGLGGAYSVSLWFWNGLPEDARPVTGYLLSRGPDGDAAAAGDHLGVGGTFAARGRLFFFNGNRINTVLAGSAPVAAKAWNHVVMVRDGKKVTVYLNGKQDLSGDADVSLPSGTGQLFVGGRNDNFANFEGKLDEVAVWDRALGAQEAGALFSAAGVQAPTPSPPYSGERAGVRVPPPSNGRAPLTPALSPGYRGEGVIGAAPPALRPDPPKSPEESLKSIRVKEGFEVELVAAEPLIADPVAIAWGPDGKLWVAEMADYPYGVSGDIKKPGGSRIRYLEDVNGDGKYDTSTLFMEGVNFPTGVMAWRKGVLVTAAPEIFYAEDTDGDGKADRKEVLYSGFTEGNPQLRVNGLRWGLDNWVYCANGWSSKGKAKSHKTGAEVQVDGRDIRIRPDTGEIETESGMSEFGRDPDDWGNWFGCDNSHPMWHFVLSDRYTKRNPHVPPPDPRRQLMTPFPPKLYPISKAEKRYHGVELAGYFQSACSATVYRDELLFGPEGRGPETQHAFVCDPVHNLVHHEVITEDGVSFRAARPEDEKTREFLASTDTWFRPVMTLAGPDGALWVVDMYRFMIEHPDWLPQLGKDELRPFYRHGEDKGRIYRVYPKGRKPRPIPNLDRWRTIELARAGPDSPSGWVRDTAQQLMLWKKGQVMPEAGGELRGVVYGSQNPLARVHALGALEGLGVLTADLVRHAMTDSHPAVRRVALRLAEPLAGGDPQLVAAMESLAFDPDAKVRLQLACSLGEWDGKKAGEILGRLANRCGADEPFLAAAILSSAGKHFEAVVDAVAKPRTVFSVPLIHGMLQMAMAADDPAQSFRLLSTALSPGENGTYGASQMELAAGWLDMLKARNVSLEQFLGRLPVQPSDLRASLSADLGWLFDAARRAARDETLPARDRAAAASLLGRQPERIDEDRSVLASLLIPHTPVEVQRMAVARITKAGGDTVPQVLMTGWASHSLDVRAAVADALMGGEGWALQLLEAVDAGTVAPLDLDTARRQRLLNSPSQKVKALAQKVLGGPTETSRQKVVEAMRPVLGMTADAKRGKQVFVQNCAVCHTVRDLGQEVGPPLLGMAASDGEALLVHLLDPNRNVEPKYVAYNATLGSGEVVFGVITSETGSSLTMKGLDGKERSVLRSDLKSLASTNRSLMPDGFESGMTKQDLADVIRFLQAPDEAQ